MQQGWKTAISKVMHSSIELQNKQLERYTGAGAETHKTNSPKTNCKV